MISRKIKQNDRKGNLLRGWLLNLMVSSPALLALAIIMATQGSFTAQRLGFCFFLPRFTGVIVIIRQESPTSIGSLRGKWAIWSGVLFTTVLWSFALMMWFLP